MNDRQKKIIEYLKNNTENISTKDISEKFDVSRRTVFSDLNTIELFLKSTVYELIRNDGKGLSIIKSNKSPTNSFDTNVIFNNDRRLQILKNVIFCEEAYNIDSFADMLYISTSTLINDIGVINEVYLNGEQCKLIIKNNLLILSDYKNMQRIYVKFNEIIYNTISQSIIQQELIYNIYYEVLNETYGAELVYSMKKIIYNFIKGNYQTIAGYYLDNIVSNLIVLVYIKLKGNNLNQISYIYSENISFKALSLIEKMEKKYDVKFDDKEKLFIADLLKGNKFVQTIDGNYDSIILTLISQLSEILDVNLNNDTILLEQLRNHFPPLMYRMSNDIQINNPFIVDIKKEYLTLFNAVWMVVMYNQEKFEYSINDNEIGLITIYVQSALDRNKVARRIALINSNKMMSSDFILNRISNVLTTDEIEVFENVGYSIINQGHFDFIINTGDKQFENIPTVNISPVVSDTDLKNIANLFTNTIFKNKSYMDITTDDVLKSVVTKYFKKETTFLEKNFKNKEQLLEFSNEMLIENNIVTKDYLESVLVRETKGSTEINNFISIPHGNPNYVKDNCVLTIVNKTPFIWTENKVQIVFLVNVSRNDMNDLKNLFNIILRISNTRGLVQHLLKVKTYDDFINLILQLKGKNND
ncbi:BglG family transcription antiterminator [Anaerococcus provencensis]|uniref:BglG family transcription antiterminator n=1 Tax=Anaerococcus provencensis TaxID=938293 RepID=UPI0002DFE6FE|nr:PTS sugar transporter subunit IIA [Anaerococcus provencensis]